MAALTGDYNTQWKCPYCGDGSTDDTAAINRCADVSGRLDFEPGSIVLTNDGAPDVWERIAAALEGGA